MVLCAGESETKVAFQRHFEEELALYGTVCVVNLTEQSGKERVVWDAFTNHIMLYNHPDVTYVTFDFHEYWWEFLHLNMFGHNKIGGTIQQKNI